jgi:hypothetical protein
LPEKRSTFIQSFSLNLWRSSALAKGSLDSKDRFKRERKVSGLAKVRRYLGAENSNTG